MKKRPLLIVEWDDITTSTGWRNEEDDRSERVCHNASVGWKVKSSRKFLQITPMRDDQGMCDDRQIIPRGCITSIRRVE